MEKLKLEIAVYGKGGIGKSTISANLSAALAMAGQRVLQIGCDPKHDSTRLLLGGQNIPTVLEYLRDVPREDASIDRVLRTGTMGVGCIEAGGPRPGVGCAGRGIISAFEFLERNRVKQDYDLILYDVLGDVVCGGFAVPMRREYADAIFLVTSGEFMALYAANNILRGIRNYDGSKRKRVAGILFNSRDLPQEKARVERFARAVGLPICAQVHRSTAFTTAESRKCTVMELEGFDAERRIFTELAHRIAQGLALYEARPLTDGELEACVLEGIVPAPAVHAPAAEETIAVSAAGLSKTQQEEATPVNRPPLYGCAFNGAATTAIHLTDAVVIAHSPRSCAFYTWQNVSSPGRKNLFHRGILMPSAISPNFECTEMGQTEAVFGGTEKLIAHVRSALERKPGAVVVISSCVSGIIGDDVAAVEALSTPETPVIVIKADGDIAGDYMDGIELCLHTLAERLIDRSAPPRPMSVNLIGETGVANELDVNFRAVRELLGQMGIAVNCRFLGNATAAEVKNLLSAPLNILASDSEANRKLRSWLEERYGCVFFDGFLPVGFQETKRFLERIGSFFGCGEKAAPALRAEQERFDAEIAALKPYLAGKKILMSTINANMDWLLETASAAGMEFVWIGVLNYLHTELSVTEHPDQYPVEEIADWPAVMEKIRQTSPDLVLSNYTSAVPAGDYIVDNMPMSMFMGFRAGIPMLRRWALLTKNEREGGWVRDKALFEKYFG